MVFEALAVVYDGQGQDDKGWLYCHRGVGGGSNMHLVTDWKQVEIKDLPLYINFKYKTPRFDQLLKGA